MADKQDLMISDLAEAFITNELMNKKINNRRLQGYNIVQKDVFTEIAGSSVRVVFRVKYRVPDTHYEGFAS